MAARDRGAAVLLVSEDLDELLAISDRLAVLNAGRLSPAFPTGEASPERIGLLMGGVHGEGGPQFSNLEPGHALA